MLHFSIADDEEETNDCGQMFTRSLEAYLKAVQHRKRERQVGVESRLVACASFCKEYRYLTLLPKPVDNGDDVSGELISNVLTSATTIQDRLRSLCLSARHSLCLGISACEFSASFLF